jgi:hypothetical protein
MYIDPYKVPNAQKWTMANVLTHLEKIEQDALKPETMYLVNALVNEGLYKDIWRYWKNNFGASDDIMEKMLRIESIFEARLFVGALKKELSPGIAIFGLKNNHKWTDRQLGLS